MTEEEPKDRDKTPVGDDFLLKYLPGSSPAVVQTRQQIMRLNMPKNRPLVRLILITGESGAGKNHLARVIAGHRRWLDIRGTGQMLGLEAGLSHFSDRFIEINLPGVPDTLVESELFGYKSGAFTGAVKEHTGYFGQAYDDILLDEIGDASPSLQAKLLGVLETGGFRPLGGNPDDQQNTAARILAATNHDLADLAAKGQFRRDLLWRVGEFVVSVPSLRDQAANIPDIIRHVEEDLDRDYEDLEAGGSHGIRLSEADLQWAEGYHWPGNVRQLRHAIKRWRFDDGETSFREIATACALELGQSTDPTNTRVVRDYVKQQLRSAVPPHSIHLGSLGKLISGISQLAQDAVVEWYDETAPTPEMLGQVFPDMAPRSVQNKISKWRRTTC